LCNVFPRNTEEMEGKVAANIKPVLEFSRTSCRFGAERDRCSGPEERYLAERDRCSGPEERYLAERDRCSGPEERYLAERDRCSGPEERYLAVAPSIHEQCRALYSIVGTFASWM
jgi:hypothetical protein